MPVSECQHQFSEKISDTIGTYSKHDFRQLYFSLEKLYNKFDKNFRNC